MYIYILYVCVWSIFHQLCLFTSGSDIIRPEFPAFLGPVLASFCVIDHLRDPTSYVSTAQQNPVGWSRHLPSLCCSYHLGKL